MASVAGNPFIYYVIQYCIKQGVDQFIFSLGYKHEVIVDYLENLQSTLESGTPLYFQYSIEEEALGTGGAIRLACTKATAKTVFVLNGDTFFNISLTKLLRFHELCEAACTLSLKFMKNFERYGVVELNTDYSIKKFMEKQWYAEGLINGGVYALHTAKFMEEGLPEKFSFEKDYLEKLFPVRRMFGVVQDAYFIDIGIPEDYQKAQVEMNQVL